MSLSPGNDQSQAPDSRAQPLIEACDLNKWYGTTHAVRGVSFAVQRGEVVGFLGPNGAGKSTTLKMLTGFLRPSSGQANILGYDMAHASLAAQAHIGYLPENAPLYDDMMVVDFLQFVADLRGLVMPVRRQRLREVVERCGLGDVLGKDISDLSKGFRQRVGLAQALLADPDLLILDEPTSGLDPNQIVDIRALIRDLGRDKTVLLSTHILSEVQAVCSRAIIINDGKLVADAAPSALGNSVGAGVTLEVRFKAADEAPLDAAAIGGWLGELARVQSVQQGDSLDPSEVAFVLRAAAGEGDVRVGIFALAVQHGLPIVHLQRHETSLEETFQRLTGAHVRSQGARHAA